MTFLEQLYDYKNGLEVAITFFALAQGLYLCTRHSRKNIALLHGSIFLLLTLHFLLLTLRNTFHLREDQFLSALVFACYGPLSFFMTTRLLYQRPSINWIQLAGLILLGTGISLAFDYYYPIYSFEEYAWNLSFLGISLYLVSTQGTQTQPVRSWLVQFLIGFSLVFGIYPVVYLTQLYYPADFLSLKIPYTIFFLLFIINNFRHVILRPHVLKHTAIRREPDDNEISTIIRRIDQEMRIHKHYLQGDLDLKKLAGSVGYGSRLVSQAINRTCHQNFNQFLNEYRLNHAVEIMHSDTNQSKLIKEIMYDSGFTNKVNFINSFKHKFSVTPSVYRNMIQSSRQSLNANHTIR